MLQSRSSPKSELAFPALKELQPRSISTPDALDLEVSLDIDALRLPDDVQARLDRDSVNAENSKVYDRDLDLKNGIRLLRIEPGGGPLCVTFQYASFNDPPGYDAISYSWGTQPHMESVKVDAKDDFRLSRHLHAAMLRLRRPHRERSIWIDQMSVNQADVTERSGSVQLMREIYANARRVIVWIGETEPDTPTCRRLFADNSYDESQLLCCTQPGIAALEHDDAARKPGNEFDSAKHLPTVYIGPHTISWTFFAQLMRTNSHDRLPMFHHIRSQDDQSLLQLLSMAQDFQSRDPRGRIYALLGLVKGGQHCIEPDDSKSISQLYEEATLYLTQTEHNLDFFLDGRLERNDGDYSTWVPQFTQLRDRALVQSKDMYEAGPGEPEVSLVAAISGCSACTSAKGRALRLRAIPFGRIIRRSTEDTLPAPKATQKFNLRSRGRVSKPELSKLLHTLDQVFQGLEVDFKRVPALPLDQSPAIGFLMLDYIFGGARSVVDEYNRVEHIGLDIAKERRALRRMDQLATKFGFQLTAARKLNMKLAAIWENACLTVRHKAFYTPVTNTRQLLLGDQQEMYQVPAKLRQRDFFATADDFIGMAPATLEVGDEVIVPFGASRPFVIRSHGDHHVLIGDAIVPGIMSGQMVNLCKEGTVRRETTC
ncbi:hypothetical protein LTR29_003703 [Friedmanniomyces endolithicus]|nr:hypothetical protein LTR29_003703 [Friedmanniomyces endolithicus]